ncbi:unnamed protein product [Trichobilharzia szidati]|nr:unnamed protein product [Trichobilharzia szidati]
MENHLLSIDRENSVILRRKVTELEKDIECGYKRQDNMRAALEKCQIFNEKLQLDNDELHSKLTSEKEKYAEAHGNLLKSEALIKLLQGQTKMIEEEVQEMRTKVSEVKKELEEERYFSEFDLHTYRANCSKLKETLEACEIRYNELKLSDEENRKALSLAHSEIKGREEQQEELKNQLTVLNQEKQENILKQMQLSNNINNLTMQLEYSQQEVGQQKLREKSIQEQNQRLETMKNQLQKQTDDMTNEIVSLKEKLNQKDLELKQKQDDIDSLRQTMDRNTIESSEGNKELVKKLNELLNLIDKLGEETREVNRNKMEILKKQAMREEEIEKLKAKTVDQEKELKESHDESERLRGEMRRMKQKDAKQERILAENNKELVKLRAIEREYREFQHQIYSNSPPISTQLPAVIPAEVTQTPRSPDSSLELDGLGMNGTTATTPNSILRQPGPGSKRRRVSFAPVKYEAPDLKIQADQTASDDSDEEYKLTPIVEISPSPMNPPNNSELQTLEQVENIRRTPRRHGHEINQDSYSLRRRSR